MSNQFDITKEGDTFKITEYTVEGEYKVRVNYFERSMADIDSFISEFDTQKAKWQTIKTLCEGLV